jgi:hypothetical protein
MAVTYISVMLDQYKVRNLLRDLKIQGEVFWVVTPCNDMVGYLHGEVFPNRGF